MIALYFIKNCAIGSTTYYTCVSFSQKNMRKQGVSDSKQHGFTDKIDIIGIDIILKIT